MPESKVVEMKTPRDEALEVGVKLGTKIYEEFIAEKKDEQRVPERLAKNVLEMVLFFLTKAGPNVAQTGGKAKLAMSLVLDNAKEAMSLELKGGMTLCAGGNKWSARHVENDQITIDFETE